MSNYAKGEDIYLASAAQFYGSIEQNVERIAIAKGFVTRNGTVNINKLAEKSGVSTSTLWYLLKDKRRFRAFNLVTLAKLCWALGVTPGDLLEYIPGGSARGLGYSSDAFSGLMGTRSPQREYTGAQTSDEGGSEGDEVRGTLGAL